MKNSKTGLFVLGFIFCLVSNAQVAGTSFADASRSKQAQLTYVYNNATDFAKKNDKGEVVGVLVDLMKEFEAFVNQKHGVSITVEYEEVPRANFSKFLTTVREADGGVFGLSNTSITEERKQLLKFSPPFIRNILVLVTHNSVTELTSMNDIGQRFADMKAFSVTSSVYLKRLERIKTEQYPNMEIVLYNSGAEAIEALANDPSGFAIIDLLYYLDYFKKGYAIKRHKIGDEQGDDFGIIMPLNSDWKPVLDDFLLSGFLQSPRFREIVSNHLSKSALRLIR